MHFNCHVRFSFSDSISSPIQLATEEDDDRNRSSTCGHQTVSSHTSTSLMLSHLPSMTLPLPVCSSPYYRCASPQLSYFNTAFETTMKQHLNDDEPIPFIDDTLSISPSRKSSTCWSDRTSWSSRFGLAWKLNLIRSNTQLRPITDRIDVSGGMRRFNYRTIRYAVPSSRKRHYRDQL
jgi:hypothetical protein